jgi:methylenetetrahydrofolate dehydrogenase (NADP+)/methenyltetrahydrofolate cyclohydrolase
MKLFEGRRIADEILTRLKKEIKEKKLKPKLAVILVGEDEASKIYIRLKKEATERIGAEFELFKYDTGVSEGKIISKINELNKDNSTSGIIVQLPLPFKFDRDKIIGAICPRKDVDGFHEENRQLFTEGRQRFEPVLPSAILMATKDAYQPVISAQAGIQKSVVSNKKKRLDPRLREDDKLKGKKAVALVNSDIFGEILKIVLEKEGIDFKYKLQKVCLISGVDEELKGADIVITVCGCPNLVRGEMIKKGAVLIDAGIFRAENGKVVGDVDRASVENIADYLTPVPGGIGPLVIALLLKNIYLAAKNHLTELRINTDFTDAVKNAYEFGAYKDLIHKELSYEVIGILYEVYNELGYGHNEKYYQRAAAYKLQQKNLKFKEQLYAPVMFQNKKIGSYYLDFLIADKIILELKKGDRFYKKDIEQTFAYLKIHNIKLGLLARFTNHGVKVRRIVNITE